MADGAINTTWSLTLHTPNALHKVDGSRPTLHKLNVSLTVHHELTIQ